MNAIDLVDTGHTSSMIGKLVRDDKDIDDLIAGVLHRLIKIARTPVTEPSRDPLGGSGLAIRRFHDRWRE